MFAVCIESSHQKGMGHLFRMLHFISLLNKKNEKYIVVINDDEASLAVLTESKIPFETVMLNDYTSGWEQRIIKKHEVKTWINDRLETDHRHAEKIKELKTNLIVFDDTGSGAALADINFALMPCFYHDALKGRKIKKGLEYFILNEEIKKYQWKRTGMQKIVVTLGGSDTYGVTLKVASALMKYNLNVTIITGPAFKDTGELSRITGGRFEIKKAVPSLAQEFSNYDLAVTGGGLTPFEANAAGLPCIIIANEPHEIENGKFLEKLGSSVFLGHYQQADFTSFPFDKINIEQMSEAGINNFHFGGAGKIYNEIADL